jgi:hypothetical protein
MATYYNANEAGAFGEGDPLLDDESDPEDAIDINDAFPQQRKPRLPCIIRDVEGEIVEAARAQMHIYPQQQYSQMLANRILYVSVHPVRPSARPCVRACVRACVCVQARVRACVRACVHACMRARRRSARSIPPPRALPATHR